MKDYLGDRTKMYERAEAGRMLMPLLPVIARIDGRSLPLLGTIENREDVIFDGATFRLKT